MCLRLRPGARPVACAGFDQEAQPDQSACRLAKAQLELDQLAREEEVERTQLQQKAS